MVDTFGMVHVHDEPLGIRELDGKHLDAGQVLLDAGPDLVLKLPFLLMCRGHLLLFPCLSKKNGPAGPISPNR